MIRGAEHLHNVCVFVVVAGLLFFFFNTFWWLLLRRFHFFFFFFFFFFLLNHSTQYFSQFDISCIIRITQNFSYLILTYIGLVACIFIKTLTPAQMFSATSRIFKNTYFVGHLWAAVSKNKKWIIDST